jgi:hypothetical protein
MEKTTMKVLRYFVVSALALLVFSPPASAITLCAGATDRNCFTGKFGLVNIPGDPKHKLLEADFGYVDPNGVGWQTNKGTQTDGASIPPLLQPFVGSPWEDDYIRAAVIHDWYCDRHVRAWKATHQVFYNAMIASGLNVAKAKLMFYAVSAFGPSWGFTIPGTKCSGTKNCIQTVGNDSVFVKIPAQFDDLSNTAELKAMEAAIELAEPKGGLSLDELMAVANKAHPKLNLLDAPASGGGVTK